MKIRNSLLIASISLISMSAAQTVQNYPDTTGDVHANIGSQPHLDITSVTVTASADGLTMTIRINLAASPMDAPDGTNWGKYLIGIRSAAGGAATGNGWSRPINFTPGMTRWIGTWLDAGGNACGGQTWSYGAGSWSQNTESPVVTKDATGITIVETAANLSLDPGEVFSFDVYSSGGGGPDSAIDALSASAASVTGWNGPYTTNNSGAGTNAALQFTMPGVSSFATWITTFGLAEADQDPGDDPDIDGLSNLTEFQADLGLNPNDNDTDDDGLFDNQEDGSMVYNGPTDPGTYPAVLDSDGDGHGDGIEVDGSALGFVSDPTIRNFDFMTVAGNFPLNSGEHWSENGASINTDMTRTADVDLVGQFGWTLDYHVKVLGSKDYKFVGAHNWNNSWGLGGPGGGNIPATFTATGIHRWTFNSKTAAYSLARVQYGNVTDYLNAYGLLAGVDEDLDGLNNEVEFTYMSDPKNVDTDGDGVNDDTDANRLAPSRDVVFSVNMSVQTSLGNFNPATETVVVDFFNGNVGPLADLALFDLDEDGIYTGTQNIIGALDASSGGYKFKIVKTGDDLFESNIFDRSFNLAAVNATQTLPTVFFNTFQSYADWALANAGGLAADQDSDGDGMDNGIEYFMGQTGSTFTANPPMVGSLVSWPRDPDANGATFKVWSSDNLSTWADVTANADTSDPNFVKYTLPAGDPKRFVRLEVLVP